VFDLKTENPADRVNFAPLESLRKAKKQSDTAYRESSVHSYLKEVFSDLRYRNVIERREHAEGARLMASLRSGKLIMFQDPVYGHYSLIKNLPRTTNSDRHNHPLAQVNSTSLTSIWSDSKPKVIPRDFGNTNESKIIQATIEQIIQHYDTSQITELFHQQESLIAMDWGTIAIRVQYDEKLNTLKQISPILEDKEQKIYDGYGYCATCGYEGTPKEFQPKSEMMMPQCPHCGSFNISDLVPEQIVKAPVVVAAEEFTQGDIAIDLIDIGCLNWDMRYLIQDDRNLWTHQQTEVSSHVVRSLLNIDIQDEDGDFDDGLRVLNALGTRGGSVRGWGRDNIIGNYEFKPGTAILHELWLKPDFYAGRRAEENEKTVSGISIKKGQLYSDIFPDGMYCFGFNDMTVMPGVFNEKCRTNSTVYHIQANSGVGKGTQDSIEVSEHLNIAHSAAMAQLKRFAAGAGTWYDSDVMSATQAKALMKPGGLVGIKMRGTNYNGVEAAIKRLEMGPIDNGNLQYVAQLSNLLNIVFQTTNFTDGVASDKVDINTLGGQEMLQAQNMQRSAATLRMKAYLRARVFEDVLELFRTHIKIPKLIGSNDKFSLTKGKFISGAELPEKIYCDAVGGSEQPTNRMIKRINFERLLEKLGGAGIDVMGLIDMKPRLAAFIAREFDVDLPIFNYTEILMVCQKRIDFVLQKALEEEQIMMLSGIQIPVEMAAEQVVNQVVPPVQPTEDNATIKAEILREYVDDEAADSWTPLQAASVQSLIWRHYRSEVQFQGGLMAMQQGVQLALQAQAAIATQAIQQPMIDQQNQQMQMQGEQQMQGELMGALGGQIAEEESFSREQEGADMQFQRDEERANRDHKRSLEIEKLKVQGRNRPKAAKK